MVRWTWESGRFCRCPKWRMSAALTACRVCKALQSRVSVEWLQLRLSFSRRLRGVWHDSREEAVPDLPPPPVVMVLVVPPTLPFRLGAGGRERKHAGFEMLKTLKTQQVVGFCVFFLFFFFFFFEDVSVVMRGRFYLSHPFKVLFYKVIFNGFKECNSG